MIGGMPAVEARIELLHVESGWLRGQMPTPSAKQS